MKAYRGRRGRAPLIPNFSISRKRVVNFTLRSIYTRGNNPNTHVLGDWKGPGSGRNVLEKRKIFLPRLGFELQIAHPVAWSFYWLR